MRSLPDKKVALIGTGLFLAAWALLAYMSMRDNVIGLLSDSYVYLLLADYFSPFQTIDTAFAKYLLANYAYPPGFPILLGLLGGGSTNLQANYLIDAGFLAATVGAFYIWVICQRNNGLVAFLLSTVFLLLPVTLISGLGIFSEHPYMFAILIAAIILSKERLSPADCLWAALLVGIATSIRTVGVASIFALAIVLFKQVLIGKTSWRNMALFVLLALAPSVSWSIIKFFNGYDQSYVNSVVSASSAETLDGVFRQLSINSRALWHYFASLLGPGGAPATLGHQLIGALTILGWLRRMKVCAFEALYVCIYLGIILVWPYPNHMGRFLFVVLPFLMFFAYDGAHTTLRVIGSKLAPASQRRIAVTGLCVLIAALAGRNTAAIIGDIVSAPDKDYAMLARTPNWHILRKSSREIKVTSLEKMLNSMIKVRKLTPKQACVTSTEPHYVHYFAHRRSSKPPAKSTSEEIFKNSLADCPFVFMFSVASHPPSEFPMMYPFHRIQKDMKVLDVRFFNDESKKGTVSSMLVSTGEARDYEPQE